jgi:hypothetical protein
MKIRPRNRGRKFNGTTLRLEQRIINGRGRWYLEQQELKKMAAGTCFRKGGAM